MKLNAFITAAVLAAMPLMAGAATISTNIADAPTLNDVFGANNPYHFSGEFANEAAGSISYVFENTTASSIVLSVAEGTVQQTAAGSFGAPGVVLSWAAGESDTVDSGVNGFIGPVSTFIAAGATDTLTVTWGAVSGITDIDFTVVSTVPVPAGVLLMGTALAGFGVMRRRKGKQNA